MSNLIEFPAQSPQCALPDYSGHILMLDLTKARKWQCFNFFVGPNCKTAVVEETASMDRIHAAVEAGILLDITEHPELFVPEKPIADVVETDTGMKLYTGTRQFFADLDIFEEGSDRNDPNECWDETVTYSTQDPAEQERIAKALSAAPGLQAPPVSLEEARSRAQRPLLILPEGTFDEAKYLLPSVNSL